MCGIVGLLDPELGIAAHVASVLGRMRSSIKHRGPDDEGEIVASGVGLAMQRLSIVDLDTGHQPMLSEDGKIWLVFNGEIYNHAELRRRHESMGRQFRTRSDTEVVLAQYERFGLNGIHDLNGMFAFAVWDGRSRQLHLARDRMGKKPLYYFVDRERFYFASEIKALIASGRIEAEPNDRAVWDYLTFRYVPAPETIWKNIFKLAPAHTLSLTIGDHAPAPTRYWDMPYTVAQDDIAADASEETFAELFEDAVRIRMLADVPVGLFLSGGLDSSAIAASVDRAAFPQLKTFSVALQDAGLDDERDFARLVAQELGTDHTEVVVSEQQFIDELNNIPFHTDEPMADPTCVPIYLLSKAAREQVKVVLSGEGSDEILGGYTFDVVQRAWDKTCAGTPRVAAGPFGRMLAPFRKTPERERDFAEVDLRQADVPLHITNYMSSNEKHSIFKSGRTFPDSVDVLRRDLRRVKSNHPLHQALYLYCQNWLVEDLLMKADKMTMAASLELRTPFLDYRLVEWSARAPAHMKVRRIGDGDYVTKAVLRDYARCLLPKTIIERPKKGFPVPVYDWLSGRLRPLVLDLLAVPQPKCARWLDPAAIKLFAEKGTQPAATVPDRHRLWNLVMLELWAQAWLK